jgi:dipeptidyl aminopeptidase/acylaminoacyl peptidase
MRQIIGILLTSTSLLLGACATNPAPPPASAVAAAEARHPRYTAQQFFETTSYAVASPDGIAFSKDGKHLLITTDASGVFNAYLLPLAGGTPIAVTNSTDDANFGASFFPSDDRVLFTADQGGNELNHLYVREADGSVRDLTPGERLKAGFLGWSADGRSLFVSTNERDPQMFDVYAYDTVDYQRRMIFRNEGFIVGDVSPDGRHLALVKAHSSADNDIYLVRAGEGAGEAQLITRHEGSVAYDVHGFTPDGRSLIYGTNETSEFSEARAYDIGTGENRPLISADWDVMFVAHSPNGRYRIHALNEDGSTVLTITDTTTGRPLTLHGVPEGNLGTVRFSRDESMIAFTVSSDTSPSDIFVADLANGRARRLTTALNPAIDEGQLVEGTVARFPSYDGLEIPGILYRPREASAANPVPGVVLVHGGPGGQSRRGYSAMIQHLVNNGYAVYAINNRGSSGYGKTFYHLDDRKHGDADLRDVTASRDWLASKDWVSDRIAVMGGSYGGYITAAALAFHPEVFDAGINIFGVTNWVRTMASIPAWWGAQRVALFDEMGDPAVDAERHKAISPLFHATKIRRPMLVVQGANDPRVLQVESDEIVAAVRANGVPVEYLLFSDEGHGFRKKQNRIDASEAYLRFLNEQLR